MKRHSRPRPAGRRAGPLAALLAALLVAAAPTQQGDGFDAAMARGAAALQAGAFAAAQSAFEAALGVRPGHPSAQAFLGNTLLASGELARATELLETAASSTPDYYPARLGLGRAYLAAGRTAEAIDEFQAAARADPADTAARLLLAQALMRTGRTVEARTTLGALLEAQPDQADAWLLMGEIAASDASSFDGILLAAEFYQEGLQLRPGDPRSTMALAGLYLRLGLFGSGRELLAGMPDPVKGAPSVQILDGRLAAGDRDYAAAAAAHRRAIEAGGGAQAWYWLGVAQINLSDPDAAQSFAQATQMEPAYGTAWRELGKVHLDANRPDAAGIALDEAVALLPGDAETHYLRGMVLTRQGEIEGALADLELALSLDPRHTEAKYNLAMALRRTGELERSQTMLTEAQEERRTVASGAEAERQQRGLMILRQGYARYRLGQPQQALELLDQAATLVQDNDLLQLYRGLALAELGQPEEALIALETAARLNDARPDTWQALVLIYGSLDRPEDARRAQARLTAMEQQSPR